MACCQRRAEKAELPGKKEHVKWQLETKLSGRSVFGKARWYERDAFIDEADEPFFFLFSAFSPIRRGFSFFFFEVGGE